VRNRSDGAVEAMVQGEQDALEAIVRWARRGPERAHVERVEIADGSGDYSGFDVTG
jgi:acylphosphatase